jgi:hypothetical protein
MAYLDNTSRVNGRIFLMAIPAVAFFVVRWIRQTGTFANPDTLDELMLYISAVVWVSPLFVLIQLGQMASGTAARSWQNLLLTVITAAAAFTLWQASGVRFVG